MMLPDSFLRRPITHRALHNRAQGRVENSLASIQAAIDAGFGIEIDVQLSADGHAMVFHDYVLDRLTAETGPVNARNRTELEQIQLTDDAGTIPSLDTVLETVAGRVPLLIEIKDQDGAMGTNIGALETATAKALTDYAGDVAVMSFNPHSVAKMAELAPNVPRGITTSSYMAEFWPEVPDYTRDRLRDIPDYDAVGACFISHEVTDLSRPRVAEIKAQGANILCWTVRSPQVAKEALKIADNVTFEGYV